MRGSKFFLIIIIVIASVIGILLYYFNSTLSYKEVEPFGAIPQKSVVAILRVKSYNQLHHNLHDSTLSSQELFNNFLLQRSTDINSALEGVIKMHQDTTELSSFKNRSFLISCHLITDSTFQFIYHFSLKNKLEASNLIALFEESCRVKKEPGTEDIDLFSLEFKKGFPLYLVVNKAVASFSFSKNLLLESVYQQTANKTILSNNRLNHLMTISKNSDFDNIFINHKLFKQTGTRVLSDEWHEHLSNISNSDNWAQFDIDYKEHQLTFNGILVGNEDTLFTNVFKDGATQLTLDEVYPSSVVSFFNYTFNSSQILNGFKKLLLSKSNDDKVEIKDSNYSARNIGILLDLWLKGIEPEFGLAYLRSDSTTILKPAIFQKIRNQNEIIKNLTILQSELGGIMGVAERWKVDDDIQIPIYSGIKSDFTKHIYGRFFSEQPTNYMIIFDEYLVFANEASILKHIYLEYLRGNTLCNDLIYKEYRQKFPNKENFFIYSQTRSGSFLSKTHLKPKLNNSLVNLLGIQLVYSDSIVYSSVVLDYNVKTDDFKDIKWNTFLDSLVLTTPKVVFDNSNNNRSILVQDAKNQLYLINDIGRILWKRPLDGRIMGEIRQLQIKGNAQNVFLFNTSNKIYQLDFNGNIIGNFPILLPSNATSTLSVFDYEQNGDFRLFISSKDKEIRVYDNRGNLVVGFQTTPLSGVISTPIQHFTVSDKDYILFHDGYSSRILDRKGNERIKLSKGFEKNESTPYYLVSEGKQNYFVTSDIEGNIVKIGIPNGEVIIIKGLDKALNHVMFPISSSLAKENYLFVTNNFLKMFAADGTLVYTKDFQYGQISEPILLTDKRSGNYVSFTDLDRSLIYLYNTENGELVDGFPQKGESFYSIDFKADKSVRIYSATSNNSLICY